MASFITLNGPWYDFEPVKLCKLPNVPADRMVEKTLTFVEFQTILHNFERHFMEY